MNSEYGFASVTDRLKIITQSPSDSALSVILGISSSAFANFKKRNSIPYERIFSVTDSLNVNLDWVLTGKGEMYRQDESANDAEDRESVRLLELINSLSPAEKRDALLVLENKLSAIEQKRQLEALMKEVSELRQKMG